MVEFHGVAVGKNYYEVDLQSFRPDLKLKAERSEALLYVTYILKCMYMLYTKSTFLKIELNFLNIYYKMIYHIIYNITSQYNFMRIYIAT